MTTRTLFASLLIVALLLNSSAVVAAPSAAALQTVSGADELPVAREAAGFVTVIENGRRICRPATAEETRQMSRRDPNLRLQAITHLSEEGASEAAEAESAETAASGLKIILRGTQQLENYPAAKAAFQRAARQWEAVISNPITIVIDVDFGPTRFGEPYEPRILGSTHEQYVGSRTNYARIRERLLTTAATAPKLALYQTLPFTSVPTDLGPTQAVYTSSAIFRALGLMNPVADPGGERAQYGDPPSIGFNSNQQFDFDPRDGIDSDKEDFESTAAHEIGHALGFISWVGSLELDPSDFNSVTTLDLFRFRPGVTRSQFQSAPRIQSSGGQQIFFSGAEALPLSTGRPDASGGDGNQASHWKDDELLGWYVGVMDPTGARGQRAPITENDLTALSLMGYDLRAGEAALTPGVSQQGFIPAPGDRNQGTLALRQYRIDVPGGATQLQVALAGETDVDLYVRYGGPIVLDENGNTNADYKAESPEKAELIRITAPALRPGTYYLAVGNYSADSSFYTVAASLVRDATAELRAGAAQSGSLSAPAFEGGFVAGQTQYQIQVPNGATQVQVSLNGNQDVDLYVRYGQRVTFDPEGNTEADYRSESPGSAESVTISGASNPPLRQGTYFIAVGNYGPGPANFTLTATINGVTASLPVTSVSAASYSRALASEAIATAFGDRLATTTQGAVSLPLPTTLGGTTVRVRDSAGVERLAPLFFVSPRQVNYQIPPGTAVGTATVTVVSGDGILSAGTAQIDPVAPAFFSSDGSGQGVAAGFVLRVRADWSQSVEPLARYDAAQGRMAAVPIDLGQPGDQVFLVLFGTGIRGRNQSVMPMVNSGGVTTQAAYAGPQGGFVGFDQVNVPLPRSLSGRGAAEVVMTVDGRTTNTVKISIR